jgi:hypothetical protein
VSIWLESWVAGIVAILMFVVSLFIITEEHAGPEIGLARIGAFAQSLILGMLIGFVIAPLRMTLLNGSGPPDPSAAMGFLPALFLLVFIRQGLLARAPLIGKPMRAYRRALLRRQIAGTNKVLARLDGMDGKASP